MRGRRIDAYQGSRPAKGRLLFIWCCQACLTLDHLELALISLKQPTRYIRTRERCSLEECRQGCPPSSRLVPAPERLKRFFFRYSQCWQKRRVIGRGRSEEHTSELQSLR